MYETAKLPQAPFRNPCNLTSSDEDVRRGGSKPHCAHDEGAGRRGEDYTSQNS